MITDSYDKKIIIYDYTRGQVTSKHSNKSAVTIIVLSSDKKHLHNLVLIIIYLYGIYQEKAS